MAFDQPTCNRLQEFVRDACALLVKEFTRQLQAEYGMDPATGEVSDLDRLTHLDDNRRETARLLRDNLEHYLAGSPSRNVKECLERIVREQAFTVLNRLCALRMAEARGILLESIANGYKSKGFQLYARLAGTALGETGDAYRCYLFSVFDEFALDLAVLFDRFSPQGRLFPGETVLLELLDLINHPDIAPLWAEDETIGWIYQYFNSPEERRQMRAESQAPRNSRELAVRNQFFTPRYVVEFLTDNTLGRIWYEMTRGNTVLKEQCRYLVRRPNEIFLAEGEQAPQQDEPAENLSQEELLKQPVYIPYRRLKDPREIRMLDPACGSMHFGLYAFNLFEKIYEEAWELEGQPDAGVFERSEKFNALRETYGSKEALMRDVPRLIIEHNIHGIDIDPRAVQIAGLSLWLRAQRSWQTQGVKPRERPRINKSNVVCAEPMPGDKEMLREFTESIEPRVLGQLVEIIFDKMQLAGEAGSLLKIEEKIEEEVAEAREEFNKELLRRKEEKGYLPGLAPKRQPTLFDFADLPDQTQFWNDAEKKILDALNDYAEKAEATGGTRKRLFARDTARGFAFIDICRQKYDVVLMNPPFGEAAKSLSKLITVLYPMWNKNLLCLFVERAFQHLTPDGFLGSVIDRSIINKSSYEKFRVNILFNLNALELIGDLGWGVLDANVEVSSLILSGSNVHTKSTVCFDVRDKLTAEKKSFLVEDVKLRDPKRYYIHCTSLFQALPNSAVIYNLPSKLLSAFSARNLKECGFISYTGHQLQSERHFRVFWEISQDEILGPDRKFCLMYNGGEFSRYYMPPRDIVRFGNYSKLGSENCPSYSYRVQNKEKHFLKGIGFGERGEILDAHLIPPKMLFTVEGQVCPLNNDQDRLVLLGLLNSSAASKLLNTYAGQHKYSGYVNLLPIPYLGLPDKLLIAKHVKDIIERKVTFFSLDETCLIFCGLFWSNMCFSNLSDLARNLKEKIIRETKYIQENHQMIENTIAKAYSGASTEAFHYLAEYQHFTPQEQILGWDFETLTECQLIVSEQTLSFVVGSIFGRWDIRYATAEKKLSQLPDPFDILPVYPPCMLQNADGLPAKPEDIPDNYPLRISWGGILVDEEGHPEDIIGRVREALEVIWKDKAGDIEQEACEILGVRSLRDYFRKPGNFFANHLKRYSKSRRQAPIYWPISTASGSYTLWLYYHRLTDQTLYTCVNDFVEPKLKQVGEAAGRLRQKSRRSSAEEKELERLSDLELELKEFRDELLRIAAFWKPNLNDGVQITAAPLWRLFRHTPWRNKLKETWQKLENGDYDWAHLAYSIWPERVREKCKYDKSLAIAHDLEELYEEKPAGAKKKGGGRRRKK